MGKQRKNDKSRETFLSHSPVMVVWVVGNVILVGRGIRAREPVEVFVEDEYDGVSNVTSGRSEEYEEEEPNDGSVVAAPIERLSSGIVAPSSS